MSWCISSMFIMFLFYLWLKPRLHLFDDANSTIIICLPQAIFILEEQYKYRNISYHWIMNNYGLRKIYKRNYMFYYTENSPVVYRVRCTMWVRHFDRILVYYMSYLMKNVNARQKLYLWWAAWTCSSDNEALWNDFLITSRYSFVSYCHVDFLVL